MNHRKILAFAIPLAALVALTGCPPKNKLAIDDKNLQVEATPTPEEGSEAADGAGDIQIAQDWTEIPALQTVPFGYDSASLDEAGRNALRANVAILKKLPSSVKVRVEGHADDRGTVEYNIALGQRRANALRQYYVTAGVQRSRIETISFGEERPLCTAATDECWAMNRRGATKVRNAEPISVNPESLK